jgi:hypothetical protein
MLTLSDFGYNRTKLTNTSHGDRHEFIKLSRSLQHEYKKSTAKELRKYLRRENWRKSWSNANSLLRHAENIPLPSERKSTSWAIVTPLLRHKGNTTHTKKVRRVVYCNSVAETHAQKKYVAVYCNSVAKTQRKHQPREKKKCVVVYCNSVAKTHAQKSTSWSIVTSLLRHKGNTTHARKKGANSSKSVAKMQRKFTA